MKFFHQGYWYKTDTSGYEGEAEYLVSKLLEYSNVDDFVKYERCIIIVEGMSKMGCRSRNFLKNGESFLSFQHLYEMYHGKKLSDEMMKYYELIDRIKFVIDEMYKITKIDCTEYLQQILSLDMVILNDDRHFHNLGYIQKENGEFRTAPIFDNGRGLISDVCRYLPDDSYEYNKSQVIGCPFSGSLEMQASAVGVRFSIDKTGFRKFLKEEMEKADIRYIRAYQVLEKQLDLYYPV